MIDRLKRIEDEAVQAIKSAHDEESLNRLKIKYLGRKGIITKIIKELGNLPSNERPRVGRIANELKTSLAAELSLALEMLSERKKKEVLPELDITLPGRRSTIGTTHPITQVIDEVCDIFSRLGFEIVEGPDVELDYYNFEALNIPKDHPARDMQDTFYISENVVLKTHTSPIQIRVMEKQPPPVRIIAPGKAYRCDSDISHTPMFHQVEGLIVGHDVSFSHLKGILTVFVHQMFGEDIFLRFRPSYFPFTEPSAEVDILCVICRGKGCRVCGHTGWLEVIGCGMVHPNVFRVVGYDPKSVTGLAFGMGIERIAMLKFGIEDIRMFFQNNVRFLRQFC